MPAWLRRIIRKFDSEVGRPPTENELQDMEDGVFSLERPKDAGSDYAPFVGHLGVLLRLNRRLDDVGVPDRGRVVELVKTTGYSKQRVSALMAGEAIMSDRFIIAVCNAYGLVKEDIEYGDNRPATAGEYRPMMTAMREEIQSLQKQKKELLDAPTQEIVNDMKKLTESNRWVFVGRVKPIIQEMLEEQGEGKNEKP